MDLVKSMVSFFPTWHASRRKGSSTRRRGTGRWAYRRWGGTADALHVGRGVRGEGRLSWVTLLSLAAWYAWCADARTQGTLCTCREVINGAKILKKRMQGITCLFKPTVRPLTSRTYLLSDHCGEQSVLLTKKVTSKVHDMKIYFYSYILPFRTCIWYSLKSTPNNSPVTKTHTHLEHQMLKVLSAE